MLTRDQLLTAAATPLKPERVATPLGEVYVPRLTAAGLTAFFDAIDGKPKGVELARIVVDEHGARLFDDSDAAAVERLPATFSVPVSRAFREANGLVPKDSAPAGGSPSA